ncbi:hypothetical protein [Desulfoscipio gibsoniae]|uniref:Uncharacterized protein n=1 Tax=Desulfoscipio gibsoniae DSM 7213 TaxID=767817 RepID=R4KRP3_9FIRM|nr:hypothetical protein [Desulfoscipio gibsoniae]AGL02276.1 hypothetical protein Desgi_2877 [Desulfoscipio gibsoniae DSM 7213]
MVRILWIMLKYIEKWEVEWLKQQSIGALFKARLGSLMCIALMVYVLTTLLVTFAIMIGNHFNLHIVRLNYDYIFAPPLLILFPLIVPLFINWFNRSFRYSTIIVNFFEVVELVKLNVTGLRFMLESVWFMSYIMGSIILTLYAAGAFIDEVTLVKYVEQNKMSILSIIGLVHIVIYLTIRVLILPEEGIMQQLVKYRMEFWIWVAAFIFTLGYIVIRLLSPFNSIDFIYLTFVLLIALVRIMDIYKKLRQIAEKIKDSLLNNEQQFGAPLI